MTTTRSLVLLLLLATSAGGCRAVSAGGDEFRAPDAPPRTVSSEQVARQVIDSRRIMAGVRFLASNDRKGRATGSPGLDRSAAWVADRFHGAGLEPVGDSGGYLQYWPYRRVSLVTAATVVEWTGEETGSLEYGRDFAALPSRREGTGGLAYMGWARDAPDSMAAAAGRLAMAVLEDLTGLEGLEGTSREEWRWPVAVRRTLLAAEEAGALGVAFILGPSFDREAMERLAKQLASASADPQVVPLFFLRAPAAAALVDGAGGDLDALMAATRSGDRAPVRLDGARVRVAAPAEEKEVQVPNVVGRAPGVQLTRAEDYVVLMAHLDHLGVGEPDESGDSIYNGADNNASGVSALVAIADAFAALPSRTSRPILFIAVSGGEDGLLGSTWFATHPTVNLSGAVAALNMDMIGRNHPDSVMIVGYGYSSLGPLVDEIASATPSLGLSVAPDGRAAEDLFFRSDQAAFARQGIPAVQFFTGLHDDYHAPSDEADRIDAGKAARIARLVFLTAHRLATADEEAVWTEAGRSALRR